LSVDAVQFGARVRHGIVCALAFELRLSIRLYHVLNGDVTVGVLLRPNCLLVDVVVDGLGRGFLEPDGVVAVEDV